MVFSHFLSPRSTVTFSSGAATRWHRYDTSSMHALWASASHFSPGSAKLSATKHRLRVSQKSKLAPVTATSTAKLEAIWTTTHRIAARCAGDVDDRGRVLFASAVLALPPSSEVNPGCCVDAPPLPDDHPPKRTAPAAQHVTSAVAPSSGPAAIDGWNGKMTAPATPSAMPPRPPSSEKAAATAIDLSPVGASSSCVPMVPSRGADEAGRRVPERREHHDH
mmetsp:Transcript_16308/g.65893  ORF Transcript_16308/g.65893 Transcript_16308/m.65893 type:complete len:221 (-) Transcript_16308:13-675(-)